MRVLQRLIAALHSAMLYENRTEEILPRFATPDVWSRAKQSFWIISV